MHLHDLDRCLLYLIWQFIWLRLCLRTWVIREFGSRTVVPHINLYLQEICPHQISSWRIGLNQIIALFIVGKQGQYIGRCSAFCRRQILYRHVFTRRKSVRRRFLWLLSPSVPLPLPFCKGQILLNQQWAPACSDHPPESEASLQRRSRHVHSCS